MRWIRAVLSFAIRAIAASLVIALAGGLTGYFVFARAREDTLRRADAIIVLAGEHDGREEYALGLARAGWAPTVVLSDPYSANDPVMRRACRPATDIEVICLEPDPKTTRGEAILARDLDRIRSWDTVIVLTWRFHLPRTRLIFRQCYADDPGAVVMRAMPAPDISRSVLYWPYIYTYQTVATVKALWQGRCSGDPPGGP